MSDHKTVKKLFPEKYFSKLRQVERQKIKVEVSLRKKNRNKRAKKYYVNKKKINKKKVALEMAENSKYNVNKNRRVENSKNHMKDMNEWQYQHQVGYWKSRALTLEAENYKLHEQIRQMYTQGWSRPSAEASTSSSARILDKNCSNTTASAQGNQQTTDDDLSVKFVVDDNWLKFMETTERHRRELREQRESENASEETSNLSDVSDDTDEKPEDSMDPLQYNTSNSHDQMKLLYGVQGAARIAACETAIRFSYERHVKKFIPYWPNIPLKL